ncbi:MAG: hypothetical protein ABI604_15035 [Nitrospirota bacterium]
MIRTAILVGSFIALLGLGVTPAFADDVDMSAKIAAAKTAEDHVAIAAEYDKEAAAAKESAASHEKMTKSYKQLGKAGLYHQPHCAAIAKRDLAQAADLEALANAHRSEAKKLAK